MDLHCTIFFNFSVILRLFKIKAVLSSPLPRLLLSVSSSSAHTSINTCSVQLCFIYFCFLFIYFENYIIFFRQLLKSSTTNSDHLYHCDTKVTIHIFSMVITCIVIVGHCSFTGAGSLNSVPVFVQDVLSGLSLCTESRAGIICRERRERISSLRFVPTLMLVRHQEHNPKGRLGGKT